MKTIVGLGNPGKKYEPTRHNAGHWAVDRWESKIEGAELKKSAAFMNKSGPEVRKLAKGVSPEDLLIVHDDLDLEPGAWKFQFGRSAAGHKGVQSVIDALGTPEFWRLRIGIGRPDREAEEYVLARPSKEEREKIEKAIEESMPRVLEWASR